MENVVVIVFYKKVRDIDFNRTDLIIGSQAKSLFLASKRRIDIVVIIGKKKVMMIRTAQPKENFGDTESILYSIINNKIDGNLISSYRMYDTIKHSISGKPKLDLAYRNKASGAFTAIPTDNPKAP